MAYDIQHAEQGHHHRHEKDENKAITKLTAKMMENMAQGEKQCEVIRKVMFEGEDFNTYELFLTLKNQFGVSK